MNTKLVAKHLTYLRKKQGVTQEELAEELSVSRQAVSHWERGESVPDIQVLLELSKIYDTTINEILEPGVIDGKLESFENLYTLNQKDVIFIQESVSTATLVKAYMGTSPENAKWMEENLKDIDFPAERATIGRVRIFDVENAQNEIVNLINLYMR